jgi:hypothetical protein
MNFLTHIGNFFGQLLHIGTEVAQVATPFVDLAFPQVGPLYNSALGLVIAAEAAAPAAGSGALKNEQFVANLVPQAEAWAAQNNLAWPTADINKWANATGAALVASLKLIPAPTPAPTKPAV